MDSPSLDVRGACPFLSLSASSPSFFATRFTPFASTADAADAAPSNDLSVGRLPLPDVILGLHAPREEEPACESGCSPCVATEWLGVWTPRVHFRPYIRSALWAIGFPVSASVSAISFPCPSLSLSLLAETDAAWLWEALKDRQWSTPASTTPPAMRTAGHRKASWVHPSWSRNHGDPLRPSAEAVRTQCPRLGPSADGSVGRSSVC